MTQREHIDPLSIRKILIVQFRPFGDVLLATSYLEALQDHFPHASIDFLVKKPYQHILNHNAFISRVIAFQQEGGLRYVAGRLRLLFKIRRLQYDLVIDQQNGTGSGQVAFFSGAAYKLGWSHGRWSKYYNLRAVRGPERYNASRNFDMLVPLGIAERPFRFFYHIRPESEAFSREWFRENGLSKEQTLILSPGSPRERKKWLSDNYAELTDLILTRTPMKVVILWGPDEHHDAMEVLEKAEGAPVMAPPTDFNQAAAFLGQCRLLICNDGGVNHLAVAVGTPSLAIFGNTSPAAWSAEGVFPGHYHLCNPVWPKMSDSHFGLTAEDVFSKVQSILT